MSTNIFDNFKLFEKAQAETINNFNGYIPEQVLEVWNKYGFGSILNGYLNIVNPEKYKELLKDVYVRNEDALVLFTTSMGILLFGKIINI